MGMAGPSLLTLLVAPEVDLPLYFPITTDIQLTIEDGKLGLRSLSQGKNL
jgi:hypothetical protein